MPVKTKLYGKTKRIGSVNTAIYITEKMDGANLAFFKYEGCLHVAQRNYVYHIEEILNWNAQGLYKGLKVWLEDHAKDLENELHDGACIIGEWLGMGRIKYDYEEFGGNRFLQFAKSNIEPETHVVHSDIIGYSTKNVYYDEELFKWSFVSQEVPDFIGKVPNVRVSSIMPQKEDLDEIYKDYTDEKGRSVEGFIVVANNNVLKYVRLKNGQLTEHHS